MARDIGIKEKELRRLGAPGGALSIKQLQQLEAGVPNAIQELKLKKERIERIGIRERSVLENERKFRKGTGLVI
ncbi:MAG: hypothetical protein HZA36_02075 [Parcubacteria group bacterium]|nr:hypothetical protein [Parcubacteria group bacterium]